jgi:hypothetical protein
MLYNYAYAGNVWETCMGARVMVEPDVQVLMFVQYDIGLYTGLLSSFLLRLRYFAKDSSVCRETEQPEIKWPEEC